MQFGVYLHQISCGRYTAPPLVKGGVFKHVLAVFITILDELSTFVTPSVTPELWCGTVVAQVLSACHVNFLPWRQGEIFRTANRGSYATWDHYINLTGANPSSVSQTAGSHHQPATQGGPISIIGGSQGVSQSLGGAWTIAGQSVMAIRTYLSHTSIPSDYRALESWVEACRLKTDPAFRIWPDCFQWVMLHYDRRNKIHHLALIVAIFLNFLAPYHEVMQPPKSTVIRSARDYIWGTKPNAPGRMPGSDKVAFWFLYGMCMLDSKSPLRINLPTSGRMSLGAAWVEQFG
jgi:hypothetical protein